MANTAPVPENIGLPSPTEIGPAKQPEDQTKKILTQGHTAEQTSDLKRDVLQDSVLGNDPETAKFIFCQTYVLGTIGIPLHN